ncbi:MAG: class I SAM-dependent methyltransferase [Bacteroidota bacterium]|nr:class I SAM-dependent methyltransferase [Bacteroidota bacterium]
MKMMQKEILNSSGYQNYTDIKRLKFIMDALNENVAPSSNVLDVGCGNGLISISLGKAGHHVLGIDISEKAIEKAKEKNNLPNVRFSVTGAEELSETTTKYDAVICSEVLEHLNEPSSLLKYINKSLKDDGILIVTVPNGKGPRESLVTKPIIAMQKKDNWLWAVVKKIKTVLGYKGTTLQSDADDLTHIQFFTIKSLKKLAEQNNFSIKKIGKTNFLENVFPFSFATKKIKFLQKVDCALADVLPYNFTCGFVSIWQKT